MRFLILVVRNVLKKHSFKSIIFLEINERMCYREADNRIFRKTILHSKELALLSHKS